MWWAAQRERRRVCGPSRRGRAEAVRGAAGPRAHRGVGAEDRGAGGRAGPAGPGAGGTVSGRGRRIDAAAKRLEAVGPQPAGYAVEPFAGSILDALDAAGLLGAAWAGRRVFWKAIAALPMDDADRALFRRCTGRDVAPAAPVREAWVIVGRRGGKTRNAALGATVAATRRDWRAVLAPGERAVVPIIAADRK